MNRSYFALFVAFLIHALILLLFWLLGTMAPEIKKEEKKENKIKVSLKEMPKKSKDAGEVKEVTQKQPDIAPPMPKGSQLKEMVQGTPKPPIKYESNKATPKLNEPKKEIQKEPTKAEPTPKVEPLVPEKPYIPLEADKTKKETKKKDDPMGFLWEDKTAQEAKEKSAKRVSGSSIGTADLRELYGDEFGKLTQGQQKYLIDNQEIMRRITQEILNRVARVNIPRDMNVNKVNIVEFYLHPNGDMTDFRFLQPSGYHVLDQTTQETIEFAYSRYPRPDEKILVRYNVFYNLAR